MTEILTVRGTTTPCAFLSRGMTRVVSRTEFIDTLIARGYVEVLSEVGSTLPSPIVAALEELTPEERAQIDLGAPGKVMLPETMAPEVTLSPEQVEVFESLVGEAPTAANVVPRRNESKGTWQRFLKANGIPFDPSWSRDQLIAAWGVEDEEE